MNISVIITNYNYARYLPAAIDSARNQTVKPFEILVVDDGSTDGSRAIIEACERDSHGLVRGLFQPNRGQGSAFNTAFASAAGDIIAFLDADDVWKPNKLERVTACFADSSVAGALHSFDYMDAENKISAASEPCPLKTGDLGKLLIRTGGANYFPPTSMLTYRRSALEKFFPMDAETWRLCADGCLAYCTSFLGKVIVLEENLASYRIHGANYFARKTVSESDRAKMRSDVIGSMAYVNAFLGRIGYPERIDLARNLQFQRDRYYGEGRWNARDFATILGLIWHWPFYAPAEKLQYSARFLAKSAQMVSIPRAAGAKN